LRGLIFDFDGTILDTEWPAYESTRDVFAEFGGLWTIEAQQDRTGVGDQKRSWVDILEEQVGAVDRDAVHLRRQEMKNAATRKNPLLDGVLETIDAAKALGLPLAVASSSPMDWVGLHLDERGLREHFGAVATRDQVAQAKPAPDLYLLACERIGVEPTESIAIEDSPHGVSGAKAAGLYCVAVPNRLTTGLDFSHADEVYESLEQLELDVLVSALDRASA
jgi:HAD superfamily hydrolase (TIGR01509 family)